MGTRFTKFIEAYKCECGYVKRRYLSGVLCGVDSLSMHTCCSECGRTRDKIKTITGQWEIETTRSGIWPFYSYNDKDMRFIECNH